MIRLTTRIQGTSFNSTTWDKEGANDASTKETRSSGADLLALHLPCVRRAYLCGQDAFSGNSCEHRKQWILERLRALQEVYEVDICTYAVMSSHDHLVVRLDPELARGWSDEDGRKLSTFISKIVV